MIAKLVTSPEGTIRVYVAGADTRESRAAARSLACKVHGGITVGITPKAVKANRGHTWTFTPVTAKAAPKAPKVTRAPKADPRDAKIAELERMLAELKGTGAPKAPREVPAHVVERRAARAAAVATCGTCHGHGVVRARGANAGGAYRTADGAAAATVNGNAKPCTARGCKAKRAA